jgi:hypothetical protein
LSEARGQIARALLHARERRAAIFLVIFILSKITMAYVIDRKNGLILIDS